MLIARIALALVALIGAAAASAQAPDSPQAVFDRAVADFRGRERRFGALPDAAAS